MATTTQRTQRRSDALSKERIVAAAIEILDAGGESALTTRALTAALATGPGAIYWHLANKDELLAATTDHVIARVTTDVVPGAQPRETIRAIAAGVFDAIDAHPWVGAQLSRSPWQNAMLAILEGIAAQVHDLGVPEASLADCGAALVSYILGVASQNAANAQLLAGAGERSAFLADVAARFEALDPAHYPYVREMATPLREHDDREQFLAGIDLILAGIASLR